MNSWRQILAPRTFVGREWFFSELDRWLEEPQHRCWLVEAEPGFGKSHLAQEVIRRYPGSVLLQQQLPVGTPRLLVADQADPRQLLHYPGKLLLLTRPNLHLVQLCSPDVRRDHFHSLQVENLSDLASHLAHHPQADQIVRNSGGNFALAGLLVANSSEVDIYRWLWNLVEECLQQSPEPELSMQILTLISEAPEPLEVWRLCDFLGCTSHKVRQALQPLEPLLQRQDDSYRPFSPWLARAMSWANYRDLEPLHASVISYFRETYPSWDEMSDHYGWDYLTHHCDRLARTARKRDFSVLHWLGEGPFIRQKLRQGGKLPRVLGDLELCLTAAMEDNDLSRIAFYAFQLPRIRQERLSLELHRLADAGNLAAAQSYASLLPRENHRLLAWLLLAWQAADEQQIGLAERLLSQACQTHCGAMVPELNLLLVSLCACLLKVMPNRERDILDLLSRDEQSGRTASNYLTLGLIEGLEDRLRTWVLRRGWSSAPQASGNDQQRLSSFIGQSLRAIKQFELAQLWTGTLSRPPLSQSNFDQRLRDLLQQEQEVERLDQLIELADLISRQQPLEWMPHAVSVLTMAMQNFSLPDQRLRGFAQLSRLWMTLGPVPEAFDGLERLTLLAEDLDFENPLRVRILADLALGFYRLGDSARAQQLISRAAAGATSESDPAQRAAGLAFVAAATAQLNHPSRARDLAFTLLESLEPPPGPMQDHFCRLTYRLAANQGGAPQQLRQSLGQDQRDLVGLGNGPRERTYLLLGLARAAHQCGDQDWADQLLQQACAYAHQLVTPKVKAWTLSDLACLAWDMGQHDRYQSLLQEAREGLDSESSPIQRLEGLVDLSRALAHSKDRQARSLQKQILEQLNQITPLEVCQSTALPRLRPLLQEQEAHLSAQALLNKLRQPPPDLTPRQRDLYFSGLLHLELAFGEYDRALAALSPILSPHIRSQAMVDLAVGLTARDPREGLSWLPSIPRQADRLRAMRLILSELGAEKRPWRKAACQEALRQLTLLAQEDEATVDLVVSFWLTRETDRRKFELTGRRLGWLVEAPPLQPLLVNKA